MAATLFKSIKENETFIKCVYKVTFSKMFCILDVMKKTPKSTNNLGKNDSK